MPETLDAFGGLDIIVNNAGYSWDAVIQNMTDKQWYAMMEIHTAAPFRILPEASHYIREVAKKEQAAGAMLLLASPFANYITGQVLEVTGGSDL